MPSITVEDYLKQILLMREEGPEDTVSMGRLARAVGVVPGTATAMVKTLDDQNYLEYEPRKGVRLKPKGEAIAIQMLRRHRIIELFLVEILGLDWAEIHEEAERLEHAVSDRVLEKLDALLDHPTLDPHGDPIPTRGGNIAARTLLTLRECPVDQWMPVARVSDQDPAFLQFVESRNLRPGVKVRVRQRDLPSDSITIECENAGQLTMGSGAAEKIFVEPVNSL